MKYPGLCAGTYAGKSLTPAGDRCKNLYPETLTGSGSPEAEKVLLGTPGTSAYYSLQNGAAAPIANIQYMWPEPTSGSVLIIASRLLFRGTPSTTDDSGAGTALTSLGTVGVGPYKMSSNGLQVMISCAGDLTGWIFTLSSNALVQITSANFFGSSDNVCIDNYFISTPGDRRFQISNILNGTLWDALDFTTIEGGSENINGLVSDHGELWVFGGRHAEIFQNTGNAAFPFERIKSIYIPHGLAAPKACVSLDNAVFWLGSNEHGQCRVFRADGYVPKGVSNRSIEYFFNMYAQKGMMVTANMYGYQNETGHTFLVISFPSVNMDITPTGSITTGLINGAQWVYDITENEWHERSKTWNDGREGLPTAKYHAFTRGRHFVGGGDATSTSVSVMREDIYQDDFTPIKRVRVAPHITNGLKWLTYSFLRLSAQVGVITNGATDSVIKLRVSNDGGMTWSAYYPKQLGFTGSFKTEVCWRRLGRAKRRVFEFSTAVLAPVCIIDADIGVESEQ